MVKRTQAIRREEPTNWLSVFDRFVRLALKGLNDFHNLLDQSEYLAKLRFHCGWNERVNENV